MSLIQALDNQTIDKIAAGEVVEKPASVVKELVENAIDSGATSIVVEIKNGGIELIRVTDNGCGIEKTQVPMAFLRHATSKITSVDDLMYLNTLGFRGEALASISAVAKVEMVTKTEEALTGIRFCIEGGEAIDSSEVGAPKGTTIIVRNLFFNTPARRKFLKSPATEGAYISELMQHLAMSMPELSIKLIVNNLTRFHTSGNGDLKEVIYRIYGRDMANSMLPMHYSGNGIDLEGYLGKPEVARANRSYENYFINRRFVKSEVIAGGIEEAYKNYMMQHKFPFCALHINIDTTLLDVNVHPTKMEVRFSKQDEFMSQLINAIADTLRGKEFIPDVKLDEEKEEQTVIVTPEPFEVQRIENARLEEVKFEENEDEAFKEEDDIATHDLPSEDLGSRVLFSEDLLDAESAKEETTDTILNEDNQTNEVSSDCSPIDIPDNGLKKIIEDAIIAEQSKNIDIHTNVIKQKDSILVEKHEQMELFNDTCLSKQAVEQYHILGQLFKTYWLIEYTDKLFILDQHAAHEKVKYEEYLKRYENHSLVSQNLQPPIILSLQPMEEETLKNYESEFINLGFEVDNFGGGEYAIRAVPLDLYGCDEKELFEEILDELCNNHVNSHDHDVICRKIALMACKAAVKGNMEMSFSEVEALLNRMLLLDNPYNCPHGRPTLISMSKYEIEKKFKRIV